MSTSNINNPIGTFPDSVGKSGGPLDEPKPSTRVDLPSNNDAILERADNDPSTTSNPVKKSSGGVSQGASSVGKEGTEEHGHAGRSEMSAGEPETGEKKGLGDKIKEKLKG